MTSSLDDLWQWPLPPGTHIAAVQDTTLDAGSKPFWHVNSTWHQAAWFNSGVMLVRPNASFLAELLRGMATETLPHLVPGVSHKGVAIQSEQDVLNGFVGSEWAKLPLRFNGGQHVFLHDNACEQVESN